MAMAADPLQDGLGKDMPTEAITDEAAARSSSPGAAAARQSLQGRKKDQR